MILRSNGFPCPSFPGVRIVFEVLQESRCAVNGYPLLIAIWLYAQRISTGKPNEKLVNMRDLVSVLIIIPKKGDLYKNYLEKMDFPRLKSKKALPAIPLRTRNKLGMLRASTR